MKINIKNIIYSSFLFIFSISINQYYGYRGVFPIDSFLFFDSGFRLLNGFFPFKDFWAVTGLTVDVIQAFFFKIFGISWFSYVLHASFLNFLISFSTFYTLHKFRLNINFCFFYALLTSIIAYPIAGTPFPDHHSIIFSLIGLFCFFLHIKTNLNFYLFFVPIFFALAFLSKQTPSAYIFLIVLAVGLVYLIYNFSIKKILLLFLGSSLIIIIFSLFFLVNEIPFSSFYKQYILFPLTIGDSRISEFFFPIEFNRLITRFKLIHLALLPLIILIIKNILKNNNYLRQNDFLIQIALILTSWCLIIHQILTLNQKFVFFIIPILLGFSHVYYKDIKKNYFIYFLIILGLSSTLYYKISYGDSRKFMELANVNFENHVNAEIIDFKLKNLKWINPNYSGSPNDEVDILKKSINILKSDSKNKILITHYQFIASLIPDNTFSPNRTYTHDSISYPKENDEYFEDYKKFFINQIINKDIKIIYLIYPLEKNVFIPLLNENCVEEKKINSMLSSHTIIDCEQLRKN
tara:strand:+ start:2105 stop:3667 length:1563 start_codon:yes stop_codon:yes gene_type:complete